ncbi:MAG: Ni/Fe hydrogenase subunit alpha [Planctomycetes bacterium]|nr:Ni/Fe hydrogenase subunit alpha [Planctomycetota bacterium]
MSHDSHYVTRVEGHGIIAVEVKDGHVVQCRWDVPEAPRFFEAMVLGRMWHELHHITSRICGICSIGHTLASVKATEAAMDIEVSEQTVKLRKLATHAETLQSHILHVGYLVLPDLLGVESVIPLAKTHLDELKTVIRLHRLSNEMSDMICGRTTHPQRIVPGGFTRLPTPDELESLKKMILDRIDDFKAVTKLVSSLAGEFPRFERETEYIGLVDDDEYAMYDGQVGSSDGGTWAPSAYRDVTNEYVVPHSTAKHAKHNRDSYMVGALARFNLNADKLRPMGKEAAATFGLEPVNYNSFMNNAAQLVECCHAAEDSIALIDELLADGLKTESFKVTPKAGKGASAVEVPRGILFHEYEYDDDGRCTGADLVIPTNQNHGNLQRDLETLLSSLVGKAEEEIELRMEMLVRAYDPCISCSTHFLQVRFEQ